MDPVILNKILSLINEVEFVRRHFGIQMSNTEWLKDYIERRLLEQ